MRRVIVLSGPVASGKTLLAQALKKRFGAVVFKTKKLLLDELQARDIEIDRATLQAAGERLDRTTGGKWVGRALGRAVVGLSHEKNVVVDAVRIKKQIRSIREAFGKHVVHAHLTAPFHVLKTRYESRESAIGEFPSYEKVRENETEARIGELRSIADIVIATDRCTKEDVITKTAGQLGLYGRELARLVDVLVGGQWGSEGKGHVADYLAPEYDVLVRVGGPNAGHTVYQEPEPVVFHHLPSGTLANPNASIIIGPGAVIRVPRILEEINANNVSQDRISIDPNAMLIEEDDVTVEKEKLEKTIASTAQGVGRATARKVLRTAAAPGVRQAKDSEELQPFLTQTRQLLDDAFRTDQQILLEGTQGTGLSLHHGTYPFVTSRETSVSGCIAEAGIAPRRVRRVVMVCRTYPIRVGGNSGPMGIEINWAEVARRSGWSGSYLRKNERGSTTGRLRRVAEFNWTMLRQAASINGPTDVALSFTDYLSKSNQNARRFEQLTEDTIQFVEEIERVAAAPVSLIVTRFHARSVIDRRSWGGR